MGTSNAMPKNEYKRVSYDFGDNNIRLGTTGHMRITYGLKGFFNVVPLNKNLWNLMVSATVSLHDFTLGGITILGVVELYKDGSQCNKKSLIVPRDTLLKPGETSVGNCTFTLPDSGIIDIKLTICVKINGDGGNASANKTIKQRIYP